MNKYYEFWKSTLGQNDRDKVFIETLNKFDNKPLDILELGSIRRLDMDDKDSFNNDQHKMGFYPKNAL
jgi:hypothetical protein